MPNRPKCIPFAPREPRESIAPNPPADVDARTFDLWDLGAIPGAASVRRELEARIRAFRSFAELKAFTLAMRAEEVDRG